MVHRAHLADHPAVVRPLVGHQAVHPLAEALRAEAHRAPAGHRAVVAPGALQVAVCRAEAKEAAPATWKAETLVDRAMAR